MATPLWDSEQLGSMGTTKGFAKWDLIGISTIRDLWEGGGELVKFSTLKQSHELADSEYFRYIQIRHALISNIPKDTSLPDASPLEDRLLDGYLPDKAISLTYKN